MSEAQAFVPLSTILKLFVKCHYEVGADMVVQEKGGVSRWPKVVQYLLRSYVQQIYIKENIFALRGMSQKKIKTKRAISIWLHKTFWCCESVHTAAETITTSVGVLHPTIRLIVVCFRKLNWNVTYLAIINFGEYKKDKICARVVTLELKWSEHIAATTQYLVLAKANESELNQEDKPTI